LIGSGRTEFAQAAFGLRNFDSGYVEINGNRLPLANPAAALEAGLVYVPEDRLLEGLFPALSIADNLSVTRMRETATLGVTRPLDSFVTEQIRRFSIKTAGAAAPVATLSGGNQQKVLLAKWLAKRPTVLIADEPTAGIDVLTRAEIHDRLRQLARSDVAVLAICSDLDEALELADRVMVFHRGRIVLDQPRTAVNRESIMSAMMGTEGAV
jgi:rhamnose transport system ATP-binding protein